MCLGFMQIGSVRQLVQFEMSMFWGAGFLSIRYLVKYLQYTSDNVRTTAIAADENIPLKPGIEGGILRNDSYYGLRHLTLLLLSHGNTSRIVPNLEHLGSFTMINLKSRFVMQPVQAGPKEGPLGKNKKSQCFNI